MPLQPHSAKSSPSSRSVLERSSRESRIAQSPTFSSGNALKGLASGSNQILLFHTHAAACSQTFEWLADPLRRHPTDRNQAVGDEESTVLWPLVLGLPSKKNVCGSILKILNGHTEFLGHSSFSASPSPSNAGKPGMHRLPASTMPKSMLAKHLPLFVCYTSRALHYSTSLAGV